MSKLYKEVYEMFFDEVWTDLECETLPSVEVSHLEIPKGYFPQDDDKYYIMGTLTVPPQMILKSFNKQFHKYEIETLTNQRYILKILTQKFICNPEINILFKKEHFYIYFEPHKNGLLHCHFYVQIHPTYFNYSIHLDNLISKWAQLVKGNKHSGFFKFVDKFPGNLEKVKQYCKKEFYRMFRDKIIVSLISQKIMLQV